MSQNRNFNVAANEEVFLIHDTDIPIQLNPLLEFFLRHEGLPWGLDPEANRKLFMLFAAVWTLPAHT